MSLPVSRCMTVEESDNFPDLFVVLYLKVRANKTQEHLVSKAAKYM